MNADFQSKATDALPPSPTILVSAKRTSLERRGIHAWHPYYAGYSEAFVSSAIRFLECDERSLILDPWGGSGTTSIVADRMGISSISLDINPVMSIFAAAKSSDIVSKEKDIKEFFRADRWANDFNIAKIKSPSGEEIYELETLQAIRQVIESIPFTTKLASKKNKNCALAIDALTDTSLIINPSHAFCMAVIFVTLRKLSDAEKLTNPTWHRLNDGKIKIDRNFFFTELEKNSSEMFSTLNSYYEDSKITLGSQSLSGDVKSIPLKAESIDRIITSPPYLTRIDYAVSTTPELYLFGNHEFIKNVRHQTIGAPVITKNDKLQKEDWGVICNDVLNSVKSHSAKASTSYYWKNIAQYFMDIDASLNEIFRVLKKGGSGLIVVQSSYFKEIEIPLGEIYVQMAKARGFDASIAFRQIVKGHMAHVNTRSRIYKANKIYFEDTVHIRKK
jgi:DNA modification methylase